MNEFDYSQLDEFTKHKLKKATKEINRFRSDLGKSIYEIAKIKKPNAEYYQKVIIGMVEIGIPKEELEEVLLCVGMYLERELYGNK